VSRSYRPFVGRASLVNQLRSLWLSVLIRVLGSHS